MCLHFEHLLGFSLIINICNNARDQKRIRRISVETIKEEIDTAGIKKKVTADKKANLLLLSNFLEIKNIT